MATGADPFATADIRRRVLDAWAASPARFREDANAEEDLVRGGYRDRVIVELAQNAADAAARADEPGRLSLRLAGSQLVASNTGAALDAAGAESLSTLRASAKRAGNSATAGRFGVGFAAVLAVSDEPLFASATGALRWSTADAHEAVASRPQLSAELAHRRGHVPALRLPWPAADEPEDGYTSSVRLPLRDDAAVMLVRRLLDEVDDALLLALPALAKITVEVDGAVREVADAGRWQVVRRSGPLEPQLLRDRPVEERDRPWWSLAWGRPLAGQAVPATVHAPTPADEPLDLGALLIASFPLDPGRRHVAPGPLTDFLVGQAATAYAELAVTADDPLSFVPLPVAAGALDGALRAAVLHALTEAPLLRTAAGDRVHPRDAVVVTAAGGEVLTVLADVQHGLVPDHPALGRLGVRRLSLADVVDQLATLDRAPRWWHSMYAALAAPGGAGRLDSLGALPVPLADGRTVRGPRGVLLGTAGQLPTGLDVLGLRIAHPDAAHPLLLRLGAVEASATVVLDRPEVRAAVEHAWDMDDPAAIADPVLALVDMAGTRPGDLPWLAELALHDDEGGLASARDLVLPGSLLDRVADPEEVGRPDPGLLQRWPPSVLAAVGVLADLTLLRDEDVLLDPSHDDDEHGLDDEATWVRAVTGLVPNAEGAVVAPELLAVRDLDLVRDDAWLETLAAIAGDRSLRGAVVNPTVLVGGDGGRVPVPSYAAWWLRANARLHGRPPTSYAVAGDLIGVYDPLPAAVGSAGLDAELLEAIGVRTSLTALLASEDGCAELLERLADPHRDVDDATLSRIYLAMSTVEADRVPPPERVRVRAAEIVSADDALVLDAPHHLQLSWPASPLLVDLPAAVALATVLDIDTTSVRLGHVTISGGQRRETAGPARRVVPDAVDEWFEHDDLVVAGQSVQWWVDDEACVHASTLDGLARGLAWSAGQWERRLLVAAVLETPTRLAELLDEARLDADAPDPR